ncbi:MAG: ATP-binding protein [Clostridia bacterium]|nr:ATP-binding protein [Clostridia bacterium]
MIKKVFRQMLVTQILSAMTVMICMLVDSIIIGRFLGVNAMAAYGLSNPVLLVFAAIGSMLSAGIQVVCGKSMGCGDREGTNRCFSAAVLLVTAISVIGLVLVFLFSSPLCVLLGAGKPGPDNEVFSLTKDYLRGFIIGAPAFLCSMIMVPFMQMSGNRTRLVVAVAAMTVFDIVFDLLNVKVFNGGTFGMGLASSLSYYIAFFIGGAYFVKKKCMFRFSIKGVKKAVFGSILRNGIPTLVNQISLVFLVFLFNKLLLLIRDGGNTAVASYSVISTIGNICYCFGAGIGSVALTLAALFHSDEDRKNLQTVVKTMSHYAILLSSVVTVTVFVLAPFLVDLFLKGNVEARSMAVLGVRLFVLSLIPCSFNTSLKNYYQGTNRVGFSEIISALQSFVFVAIGALILSPVLGTTGIWLSWVFGESITLLFISIIVWKKNKKISLSANAYALIPNDFGAKPEDCLDLTVRSVEEAVAAAEKAEEFCKNHNETERNSKFISLCIEEMANNIVDHGFKKDKRTDHVIEIRLIFKEDKRLIRIRDNCVNFDPVAYMDLHKNDDPTVHIGIRLVMKMVKEANYVCSLGLNNLTLVM